MKKIKKEILRRYSNFNRNKKKSILEEIKEKEKIKK